MDFPDASRFAGDRDVVLVGYRGVDGSSVLDCPEVGLGAEARARLPRQRLLRRVRRRALRRARSGCRATASTSPATRCPSGSTTSRPPGGARLPAHRPAQRERRHAHGDDLRLALPEEHPPLGDDRRQPARQLPLVPAPQRRADPQVRGALRAGRRLQLPDGRPRRHDPRRPSRTIPGRWGFLRDQAGQRPGRRLLRPDARDGRGRADLGAEDDRRAGSPPQKATRAALWFLSTAVAARLPRGAGQGRRPPRSRAPTPATRGATSRAHATAARSSAAPAPTSSGPAASCSTPGPRTRTRTNTRACGTRASRRC